MEVKKGISEKGKSLGFYTVEHFRDGKLLSKTIEFNVTPLEGRDAMVNSFLRNVAQPSAWYVGIFEGNYTPVDGDTAATFVASATESTAYSESTRQAATLAASSSGSTTNSASKAVFTINATKTIYGAFLTSASAKSATTGILFSAAKFAAARSVVSGDVLQVTFTFTLT